MSSSCKDQLELIKQTLDADRVRLAQVRSHLNSSSSFKSTPSSTPSTRRQPVPASLDDQNNVFNRLYENPKRVRSDTTASSSTPKKTPVTTTETTFRPQIDSKSRQIASRIDRASLYDRAKEQRDRQEQRIAKEDANLHDLRNKSRLSTCSKELSFNPLRKEIEQRFTARRHDNGVTASELHDVLVSLGLSGFDVFNRIVKQQQQLPPNTIVQVSQVVDFFFQVFCAEDDELDAKLRVCLFAINQDIASNLRMAKSKQLAEQVAQRETPFRPRGLVKSHLLDEQRMEKLGIDPALPREEKLIQVGQKTKLGLLESQKRWQEKQQEECTFRPQLLSSSCSFVSSSSSLSGGGDGGGDMGEDVVSRLYQDSFRRRHRLQEMQSEHQAQVQLFEVSECTFQPVLMSKRKAPPPPPPPPTPTLVATTSSVAVFQAQVDLPNGGSELVTVKEGDRVQDVALRFAQRHRLDPGALAALTNGLLQALGQQEEEEQVEDALVIDIVVRPGETHQLTVRAGEDPSAAARAFAKLHRMDREALSELIDSLRSVV